MAAAQSMADQQARVANAKTEGNSRFLDIGSVYDGTFLSGKKVLVVGANKGLGLCIVRQLVADGAEVIATCRTTSDDLNDAKPARIITDVDVQLVDQVEKMAQELGGPVDYVIHNAGYFMEGKETLLQLDDKEQMKQIDICGMGPLRVVSALFKAGCLKGSKVAVISSQAGSLSWRSTQNANEGGDYGHHMSRAACNMGVVLAAEELRKEGVPIVLLHPGFNRTGMTAKYAHIWDIEGAVEAEVGAKRVLHEVGQIAIERTAAYINCEDGLTIPW